MVIYLSLPSSETQTSDFDRELVIKVATEHTDKNSHRNSCQLKRSFFSKKMESIVPWNRLCCVLGCQNANFLLKKRLNFDSISVMIPFLPPTGIPSIIFAWIF